MCKYCCKPYILIPICIILLGIVAAVCFFPNDLLCSAKPDIFILLGEYDTATHTVAVYHDGAQVSLTAEQQTDWLTALNEQEITGGHTYGKVAYDVRCTLLCETRVEITNLADHHTTVVYVDANGKTGYCTDTTVYRGFSLNEAVLALCDTL